MTRSRAVTAGSITAVVVAGALALATTTGLVGGADTSSTETPTSSVVPAQAPVPSAATPQAEGDDRGDLAEEGWDDEGDEDEDGWRRLFDHDDDHDEHEGGEDHDDDD